MIAASVLLTMRGSVDTQTLLGGLITLKKLNFMHFYNLIFLLSATKLRRLCFYVRLPVHRGGGGGCLPQCMLGYHPPHPLEQTPPGADTPHWSRHPTLEQTPHPGADTPPGVDTPLGRPRRKIPPCKDDH